MKLVNFPQIIRCCFFFLLIVLLASTDTLSQEILISIKDSITQEPIEYAFISSEDDSIHFITDKNGYALLKTTQQRRNKFFAHHINYYSTDFYLNPDKKTTAVYLKPKSYDLGTLLVKAKVIKEKDYIKILRKAQERTKENLSEELDYKYQLVTIDEEENKILESLMAFMKPAYFDRDKLDIKQFYGGAFYFNKYSPFLNLQTEFFVESLNLFRKKLWKYEMYDLILAKNLKRKKYQVVEEHCIECTETEFKLSVRDKDSKQLLSFNIDTSTFLVNSYSIIIPQVKNQLLGLIDDEGVQATDLHITGERLDSLQEFNRQFSFNINYLGKQLRVQGRIVRNTFEKQFQGRTIVLGKESFDNLYEMILFDSRDYSNLSINNSLMENIGDVASDYLTTMDRDLRMELIESNIAGNCTYWRGENELVDIDVQIIDDDYYVTALGEIRKVSNKMNVYYPIHISEMQDTITIKSLPSILDFDASQIFTYYDDTCFNLLHSNLIYNIYEIKRREIVDELSELSDRLAIPQLDSVARVRYQEIKEDVSMLLDTLMLGEFYMGRTAGLNVAVYDEIGVDILKQLIELGCYMDILEEGSFYWGLGTLASRTSPSDIYYENYYGYLIFMLEKQVEAYKAKEASEKNIRRIALDNKSLGEMYSKIGEKDKACNCYKTFKELWLDAYNMDYLKRHKQWYKKNCKD